MPGGKFIDTNIWIYAHLRAPAEPRHAIAFELTRNLTDGVISLRRAEKGEARHPSYGVCQRPIRFHHNEH